MKTKQTKFNDSNTGVYPERTHGVGCWGNRRVVMSVRIDEKLKNESTRVLKAIYGSTCRGIETYLAGLVATYEQQGISGVYPSHTVKIENLNIQRNIRSRRKLIVEEEREITETVSCSYCPRPAVAVMEHSRGQQAYACEFHRNFLRNQPSWKLSRVIENIQRSV